MRGHAFSRSCNDAEPRTLPPIEVDTSTSFIERPQIKRHSSNSNRIQQLIRHQKWSKKTPTMPINGAESTSFDSNSTTIESTTDSAATLSFIAQQHKASTVAELRRRNYRLSCMEDEPNLRLLKRRQCWTNNYYRSNAGNESNPRFGRSCREQSIHNNCLQQQAPTMRYNFSKSK